MTIFLNGIHKISIRIIRKAVISEPDTIKPGKAAISSYPDIAGMISFYAIGEIIDQTLRFREAAECFPVEPRNSTQGCYPKIVKTILANSVHL